jgi:hypothetical protein
LEIDASTRISGFSGRNSKEKISIKSTGNGIQMRSQVSINKKDYDSLTGYESLKYDKRSIFRFYLDLVLDSNYLWKIIFLNSMKTPKLIQISILMMELTILAIFSVIFISFEDLEQNTFKVR